MALSAVADIAGKNLDTATATVLLAIRLLDSQAQVTSATSGSLPPQLTSYRQSGILSPREADLIALVLAHDHLELCAERIRETDPPARHTDSRPGSAMLADARACFAARDMEAARQRISEYLIKHPTCNVGLALQREIERAIAQTDFLAKAQQNYDHGDYIGARANIKKHLAKCPGDLAARELEQRILRMRHPSIASHRDPDRRCPVCGTMNPATYVVCPECRADLTTW